MTADVLVSCNSGVDNRLWTITTAAATAATTLSGCFRASIVAIKGQRIGEDRHEGSAVELAFSVTTTSLVDVSRTGEVAVDIVNLL